ncbi:FHA domain-containing protein [Paenibacillus elgii]|uniref:FHA domain-containing protein n=1 Tax=Paenibacillus elgii TaxID=189691 RepID=A0A2T6G5I0_9BACL|nr:FHA domain-containing protein [Paenibacillus elgii]PUA39413.1 FHA domain-containing protein [Paenibacillus elgii]
MLSEKKSVWVTVVNVLIALVAAFTLVYTYIWNTNVALKLFVAVFFIIGLTGMAWRKYGRTAASAPEAKKEAAITKLALLGDDGERIKEWYIHGETSLLIGRSSSDLEVQIDLSGTEYAALVSKQHAVLNYASGNWYIEDLDSSNGVGIKKRGESGKRLLNGDEPEQVHSGDTIYIANTRLLVK